MRSTLAIILLSHVSCGWAALENPVRLATSPGDDDRELSSLVSKGVELTQQLQTCRESVGSEDAGLPVASWLQDIEAKHGSESDMALRLTELVQQTAKIESIFNDGYQFNLKVKNIRTARKNQKLLKEATTQVSALSHVEEGDFAQAAFLTDNIGSILSVILPNVNDDTIGALVLWVQIMIVILAVNVFGLTPVYWIQIHLFISPLINLFLTFITSIGGFSIAWTLWLATMNVLCAAQPDAPACPKNWFQNGPEEEEEEEGGETEGGVQALFLNGQETATSLLRCLFEEVALGVIPVLLEFPAISDDSEGSVEQENQAP